MTIVQNHEMSKRTSFFTINPFWVDGLDPQVHCVSGFTFTYKGKQYNLGTVSHCVEHTLSDGRVKVSIWIVKSREFTNGLSSTLVEDENIVVRLYNDVVQF